MRILKTVLCLLLVSQLWAQPTVDLTIQVDQYLSFRTGTLLGVGLDLPFNYNNVGIGISRVRLENFKFGNDFARDGADSARGIGLSANYKRFLTKALHGSFLSFQTDVQFLNHKAFSAFFPDVIEFKTTTYQPMISVGYHGISSDIVWQAQLGYAYDIANDSALNNETNGFWRLGLKLGYRVKKVD